MTAIQVVGYSPRFARHFKDLNEAWIKKYFELEEEDIKTLNDPAKIIDEGGFIFVAFSKLKI